MDPLLAFITLYEALVSILSVSLHANLAKVTLLELVIAILAYSESIVEPKTLILLLDVT
jgi:hypothetical protein